MYVHRCLMALAPCEGSSPIDRAFRNRMRSRKMNFQESRRSTTIGLILPQCFGQIGPPTTRTTTVPQHTLGNSAVLAWTFECQVLESQCYFGIMASLLI